MTAEFPRIVAIRCWNKKPEELKELIERWERLRKHWRFDKLVLVLHGSQENGTTLAALEKIDRPEYLTVIAVTGVGWIKE